MLQVFAVAEAIASITSTAVATVGPVGVGKSSLLNTVASYTGNALTLQAAAGIGSRSLTPGLTSHTLIFQDKHAAWKWIDTAGDTFDVRPDLHSAARQINSRHALLFPGPARLRVTDFVMAVCRNWCRSSNAIAYQIIMVSTFR